MRARRREINIFNMSLLDILCGALGAFCFMMLVALPYYKPPGSEKNLREAQAETQRLLHDLEKMKDRMSDPKAVAEMEDLIRRLEAQIKVLQGQVNILSAEKEELQRRVTQLSAENEQFKSQITQLLSEKEQLTAQVAALAAEKQKLAETNQQLAAENNKLAEANKITRALLARKKTFVVSAHCTTFIDLLLTDEPVAGKTREAASEEVNAFLNDNQSVSASHLYLTKSGSSTEIRDEVSPEIAHKIYVKLLRIPAAGETLAVDGGLITVGREQRMTRWPPFQLSAERSWTLVGTVIVDQNYEPTFKAATDAEREAEWQAVTKKAPPSTPGPTVAARSTREETAEKLRRLMRIPPDDSGAHDAEVLQLTGELLKELPPNDILRPNVEARRKIVLDSKARREGAAPAPRP